MDTPTRRWLGECTRAKKGVCRNANGKTILEVINPNLYLGYSDDLKEHIKEAAQKAKKKKKTVAFTPNPDNWEVTTEEKDVAGVVWEELTQIFARCYYTCAGESKKIY